ncbi:N-terminal acetyltransferase A, auxiliary subunit [Ramicandelaber brevisporus]|nr:N-terminal acetyltransferase A, auxiliary subunit [Ramicandelaber brevisporus]
MAPTNQTLPLKEATLFQQALKTQETKDYARGIELCDKILKKHPNHGESFSLKGLLYSNQKRYDEAKELGKRGTEADPASSLCWHIMGLIHREVKEFEAAIDCFTKACQDQSVNSNVLREMSTLQMHLGRFGDSVQPRADVIRYQPKHRVHWEFLVVSLHAAGEAEQALRILDSIDLLFDAKTNSEDGPSLNMENAQLLFYKLSLMAELGRSKDALALLDKVRSRVGDEYMVDDYTLALLERVVESESESESDGQTELRLREHLAKMLQKNPDRRDLVQRFLHTVHGDISAEFVAELEQATELTELQVAKRDHSLRVLRVMQARFPRSQILAAAPLSLLSGAEFEQELESYLDKMIRRGAPSAWSSVSDIVYRTSSKTASTTRAIERIIGSLRSLSSDHPPTALPWALYFYAQHLSQLGRHEDALSTIDSALEHTPTLTDLLICKGRLLARAGNTALAAEIIGEARDIDLQDRYINTECVTMLLRDGQHDAALTAISVFVDTEKAMSKMQYMYEQQHYFYLLESGRAYLEKQGNIGKAIKFLRSVDDLFSFIDTDSVDFHSFGIRKHTLPTYMQFIHHWPFVNEHWYFVEAAILLVKCYLHLHVNGPPQITEPETTTASSANATAADGAEVSADAPSEEVDTSKMTPAELRKHKAKLSRAAAVAAAEKERQRKEQLKQQSKSKQTQQQQQQQQQAKKDDDDDDLPKVDRFATDPEGNEFIKAGDYLTHAATFVEKLNKFAPRDIRTHSLGFEVYLLQGRYAAALRCIQRLAALADEKSVAPAKFADIVEFKHTYQLPQTLLSEEDRLKATAYARAFAFRLASSIASVSEPTAAIVVELVREELAKLSFGVDLSNLSFAGYVAQHSELIHAGSNVATATILAGATLGSESDRETAAQLILSAINKGPAHTVSIEDVLVARKQLDKLGYATDSAVMTSFITKAREHFPRANVF